MDFIINNASSILGIATAVVTIASIVANLTPNQTDNKIVASVGGFINKLALNFNVDTTNKK